MIKIFSQRTDREHSIDDLADEIHIWIVDSERPQNELKQYLDIFDESEIEKYHSFYFTYNYIDSWRH